MKRTNALLKVSKFHFSKKSVVCFGLHPDVVDYNKWPGLTREMIDNQVKREINNLNELGYNAENVYIDPKTAEKTMRLTLSQNKFDCVLIGAGVRTDPTNFEVFEKAVNIVHELQPQAKICFNTKPDDSAQAVERWLRH